MIIVSRDRLFDGLGKLVHEKITDPVFFILLGAILTGSYLRFAGIGDKGF